MVAKALVLCAMVACALLVDAHDSLVEVEEVQSPLEDHLKVVADGKTCAKHRRTRVCRQRVEKNVTKCPENVGYDFKVQPPCIAEEPCIKHSVSCGSVKIGTTQECLQRKRIRTCPQQCQDGQLCNVAKACKTLDNVTVCEWTRQCTASKCRPTECSFSDECVRYTEKASYVHRCNEGDCEQAGERVRTCKSVPVCRGPEVTETVQACSRWGRWKMSCIAWYPSRVSVLRKQYADAQQATSAAFDALKATQAYQNRAELRAEVQRATAELKEMDVYKSYQDKQQHLSCIYSELSCRYFGGWHRRREHCRAWMSCAPCEYAAFACKAATQGPWKQTQCDKTRDCKNYEKFNPHVHVVLTKNN